FFVDDRFYVRRIGKRPPATDGNRSSCESGPDGRSVRDSVLDLHGGLRGAFSDAFREALLTNALSLEPREVDARDGVVSCEGIEVEVVAGGLVEPRGAGEERIRRQPSAKRGVVGPRAE